MTTIDNTIKQIRPSLRLIAPQSFWWSIGFAIFNVTLGLLVFDRLIFKTLELIGIIPLWLWGVIFCLHGAAMLGAVIANSWVVLRRMHIVGVVIKSAWWLELLVVTVQGFSPFLLVAWSLLIYLQVVIYVYFTPRLTRD